MSAKQKTDMLIDTLVSQLMPVSPQRSSRFWGILLLTVSASVLFILFRLDARSDFLTSLQTWQQVWKTLTPLALGLTLSLLVLHSSRPGVRIGMAHWPVLFLLLAIFWGPGIFGFIDTNGRGVLDLNPARCLQYVTLAALLPFAAFLSWLKQAAPTHAVRAGTLAGCAAGAFGAFAFANYCPLIATDYISVYYSMPSIFLAGAGAVAAKYLCRW
jgi:hypothetical protein